MAKAVFLSDAALLRDSHIDPAEVGTSWQLMPTTIEAVRNLASDDTLILLYTGAPGHAVHGDSGDTVADIALQVVRQVESGGGRVDALLRLQERAESEAPGDSNRPGLIWSAAGRFGLRPEQCYVIGDALDDVTMALATGARPVIILGDRTIEEVFGRADLPKSFPMASDLVTAVQYIQVEEEITRQIGQPRNEAVPMPPEMSLPTSQDRVASVVAFTPRAREMAEAVGRTRLQRRDIARWLFFLCFGGLGLSLGVAYLLTHLYRVQPFPDFVYYLTLQFIPRPVRGLLFILIGLAAIGLGMKSVLRSGPVRDWLNGARRDVR